MIALFLALFAITVAETTPVSRVCSFLWPWRLSDAHLKTKCLYEAIQRNDEENVQVLVNFGADVNSSLFTFPKSTPLIECIQGNANPTIVRILIDAKADVNGKDYMGWTPLMWSYNYVDIVELLLKAGADVNAVNHIGRTALMTAIRMDASFRVVQTLIDSGANLEITDRDGMTPLIYASKYNRCSIMRILLRGGANIEAKTRRGKTALMIAARRKNFDAIRILLDQGAQNNIPPDSENISQDAFRFIQEYEPNLAIM